MTFIEIFMQQNKNKKNIIFISLSYASCMIFKIHSLNFIYLITRRKKEINKEKNIYFSFYKLL